MKNETTIRFTKEMDAELMEIGEATLEDAFGFGAFDDEEMDAIRNALRFAFDAGVDHAKADDNTALAFEDDGSVIKAMKAQMSPDTLSAISAAISQITLERDEEETALQLEWLRGEIDGALGA